MVRRPVPVWHPLIKGRTNTGSRKTSRKYSDEEVVDFLVSNFTAADNPQNLWIGEIINSGERTYADWKKRKQSSTYLFKEQSNELLLNNELESLFDCSKGHPILLKKFLGGNVSLETMVIYDRIFSFRKKFDKKLTDPGNRQFKNSKI